MKYCSFIKKDGKQCRNLPIAGRDMCKSHDPEIQAEAKAKAIERYKAEEKENTMTETNANGAQVHCISLLEIPCRRCGCTPMYGTDGSVHVVECPTAHICGTAARTYSRATAERQWNRNNSNADLSRAEGVGSK